MYGALWPVGVTNTVETWPHTVLLNCFLYLLLLFFFSMLRIYTKTSYACVDGLLHCLGGMNFASAFFNLGNNSMWMVTGLLWKKNNSSLKKSSFLKIQWSEHLTLYYILILNSNLCSGRLYYYNIGAKIKKLISWAQLALIINPEQIQTCMFTSLHDSSYS